MRFCHICDFETPKQSTLSMHITMKHGTKRAHKCRDCGKTFSAQTQLNHHRMNHHSRQQHLCMHPDCTHKFKNPTTHKVHYVRRHMNNKSLFTVQDDKVTSRCNICDEYFKKDSIYYHLATCSSESPFSQNYCGPCLEQETLLYVSDDESDAEPEKEPVVKESIVEESIAETDSECVSMDFDDLESIDGDMAGDICREIGAPMPVAEIEANDDNELGDLLNKVMDIDYLSQ